MYFKGHSNNVLDIQLSYDIPNWIKNLKENSMYALKENALTIIMIDTSSTSLGFPF